MSGQTWLARAALILLCQRFHALALQPGPCFTVCLVSSGTFALLKRQFFEEVPVAPAEVVPADPVEDVSRMHSVLLWVIPIILVLCFLVLGVCWKRKTGLEEVPPSPEEGEGQEEEKPGKRSVFKRGQTMVAKELSEHAGSGVSAMNHFVSILWPRLSTYLKDLLTGSIQKSINASLPGVVSAAGGVKFTEVHLGEAAPLFGPMNVSHNTSNGCIELDIGVNITANLDVHLTAMGLPLGIKKLVMKGNFTVLFTPPSSEPPFFGGMQMYFPNPPTIDMNLSGVAKALETPGLRGAIRGAIDNAVGGICVLPRRIAVDMNDEDDIDIIDLTYPEPIGVLRVRLWAGANLIASDMGGLFSEGTSDPYVVAKVGIQSWNSPTIKKNLNPSWTDPSTATVDFLVHDPEQNLFLKVFDHDFGKSDDLIGVAEGLEVEQLLESRPEQHHTVKLFTENGEHSAGTLDISVGFLSLRTEQPLNEQLLSMLWGPSDAHLSIRIETVRNLPDGAEHPFVVRVQVVRRMIEARSEDVSSPKGLLKRALTAVALASPDPGPVASIVGESLVEASSTPSMPKRHQDATQNQKDIAERLAKRCKLSNKDIGEILGCAEAQVQDFLKPDDTSEEEHQKRVQQRKKDAFEFESVKHPQFNQSLQLLLPNNSVDDKAHVDFTVIDKKKNAIAIATVPLINVLEAEDKVLKGPFEGRLAAKGRGSIQIEGNLCFRWLSPDAVDFAKVCAF